MTKHFSPRLKELAVKQFMTGDGMAHLAFFYETTPEKVEQAIRAKLLENEESLKRVAEKFIDGVFDGHGNESLSDASQPAGPAKSTKYTEA